MADEAGRLVTARAANVNPDYRFPAMWGPNFDWIPDQDHGDNLLMALELMLLQSDGERIFLLPAGPREWNVRFKLHAPHRTTIECEVKQGHVERLDVDPPSRRKDVVFPQGWEPGGEAR
jgi:hypothetical protein